jgi:alkylated DNA nucleotide flippase Atl1
MMAADQCARAWEGAYRHYGRIWELTARSPKGDPAAAREMAAASRAVAAAWRQIEAATTLPWWTVAALESAAAAFEEQAQKYDTSENSQE